ncbi:MAG: capsule biosynthesis GfcC family protein [Gammaproteobacteria bacterium]|nr:capsule biosynthesis GfcC family protein [Gammaproteobacteria bacterium]
MPGRTPTHFPASPRTAAAVLTAAFALTGCAAGTTTDIYADVVRGFFTKPSDATVSEEMLANTPFAYMEARLGAAAQSVLVLGWQEHGEDKWVSAGNEMLILRHGRVVRTLGLPVDRQFTASAEPDPLAEVSDPAQLDGREWQSTLDWNASHAAGFLAKARFRDHGMTSIELRPEDRRELRRIEERVNIRPVGIEYSNWYYFDARGQIVKSRQHVHPEQPPLTLVVVREAGPAAPVHAVETLAPETALASDQVQVRLDDGAILALPPGPQRLSEVVSRATADGDAWWPGLRLYRSSATAQDAAHAARTRLIEQLEAFAEAAEQRDDGPRAQAARALIDTLPPAPPGEMLSVVLDLDRLRVTPSLDVLLPPGEYRLLRASRPETLSLAGMAVHPGERGYVPGRTVAAYLASEPLAAGAERDHVWLVQPEGTLRQVAVAAWNREFALPRPGATVVVGLAGRAWRRGELAPLNEALAALYAAQPPAAAQAPAVAERSR